MVWKRKVEDEDANEDMYDWLSTKEGANRLQVGRAEKLLIEIILQKILYLDILSLFIKKVAHFYLSKMI